MSKSETPQDFKPMSELFERIRNAQVEPSPYLKTRVLAHLQETKKQNRVLLFWKLLSAGSLVALALTGVVSYRLLQKGSSDGVTQQAYVIHIDFNQGDQKLVAQAEVELPADVHFVSSNKEIRAEKKLKLPVDIKALGRGKLPFVVASDLSGEKSIKVRLLNENNEVVREQVMKLTFAKQGTSVVF